MNRRAFLRGLGTATAIACIPLKQPRRVAVGGTVTGRWSSKAPNMIELSRAQIKEITWARRYGAPMATINKSMDLSLKEADFTAIEARVMANHAAGKDPYFAKKSHFGQFDPIPVTES